MQPGSAEWWEQRRAGADRPRRPRANGLSLDRILRAALDIIDADGLDALTMRRLADDLGTSHPSLYRHVESHDEIVVLLVDQVLGNIVLDDPDDGPPRARAERALRRYRAVLLEHPALTPAFLQGQLLGPNALARREEGLRQLLDAGASRQVAAQAWLTLTHFAITSAVFAASGAGRSPAERAAMRSFFAGLSPTEHPTITSMAAELNATDDDAEFEFGLAALLDHVERALSSAAPTGPPSVHR
jgi:AcrR family transcriptional regulator